MNINFSGDDVLEALTYRERLSYERVLNTDGEELADLIADRVLKTLQAKLAAKLTEDGV